MVRGVLWIAIVGLVTVAFMHHALGNQQGGVMLRIRVNGVEMHYDLQGTGEPLVLIHGAQGDRSMFSGLVPVFAKQFQVLTFDQRGSGQSEKPDMDYSIALLADDTAALMDQVGFTSAHIIGVSMGGMIAQELVLRHPQKVRSLVLGCTTPGGPKAVRLGGEALTNAYSTTPMSAEERGKALAEAAFTKGYIEQHPEIIPAMIEARRQRPIDPVALGHRMKAAYAHNTYDRLPQIACPTLVITGKDDALISWENSRILAERIPGAQLVLLEPAGHVFWTEQPEQSLAAILTFLARERGKGYRPQGTN
jgi:pimeloyl-ACP methyl ester carboxylesterase